MRTHVARFRKPHLGTSGRYSSPYGLGHRFREAARQWIARSVTWYNTEHRHSAIRSHDRQRRLIAGPDVHLFMLNDDPLRPAARWAVCRRRIVGAASQRERSGPSRQERLARMSASSAWLIWRSSRCEVGAR